jgi:AraC-like DNA-binding protein
MSYQEYPPHPALTPYIKCFWSIERDFQPLNGAVDILPDSSIEIIFNLGSDCTIEDEQASHLLPDYYLVMLHEKPFRLHAHGVLKTIGVRFFAWGLLPFLSPIYSGDQHIYHLGSAWKSVFHAMTEVEPVQAVQLLEHHLLTALCEVSPVTTVSNLSSILLFSNEGGFKVAELAYELSLSKRQLERIFQRQAQITPKALSKRMRFEQVRNKLCFNPDIDFSVLALECGYSDQSHLSRDFKHFADRTLSQFVDEIRIVNEELRYGVAFPSHRDI